MRKFYQTEWHGIAFESFAELDPDNMAGPEFYRSFYDALFTRYHDWNELDASWRSNKSAVDRFIRSRLPDSRVLSLGCGVGYVERLLLDVVPDIEVTESSSNPLRWLAPLIKPECIHIGTFPGCLARDVRYGLIYVSAVDYCFEQLEWIGLLRDIRGVLDPSGRCLVITSSYESPMVWAKSILRSALVRLRLRQPGQFWGYTRSRREHRAAFQNAGYARINDGFLENGSYWIEGLTA